VVFRTRNDALPGPTNRFGRWSSSDYTTRRKIMSRVIKAGIGAVTGLVATVALTAGSAGASLCAVPGYASDAAYSIHGDAKLAVAPPDPEDFIERGMSMTNPSGKLAAWEAHFASPVVDGPEC
jgi:hypothetical protein